MKQLKTLLALVLCLVLAMPCALAEGAYVPGETVKALFAEAWSKGQMITADLSFQLELDGAALGLTEKSDATCIVVSEETGRISVAEAGEIREVKEDDLFLVLHSSAATAPTS